MLGRVIQNYRAAFSGLPREIWFLSLIMLINRSGSMVLPFLSLYVSKELNLGYDSAGAIVACFGAGSCIGSFAGGYLADRFGPFRTQIFSLLGNAVGFAVLSQMTTFRSFATVIFITSIVSDVFRPANGASITFLSPAHLHRKAFALNRLAINLGFTVGPLVGGILAFYSYQWLFWVNACTCVITAITFIALLGFRLKEYTSPHGEAVAEVMNPKSPFRDGRFLIFIVLNFATFCVFFQLISTFPLFLEQRFHLNEFQIGTLLGLNTVVIVFFEMVLIESIKGYSLLKTIAWGAMLMCLGFGILPFGNGYWFAALTVLVWTVGEMLGMPQMLAFVTQLSDRTSRSRYLGMYMLSVSLAMVQGPLIGSRLFATQGTSFWHYGTAVGALVFVGYYLMSRFEVTAAKANEQGARDRSRINSQSDHLVAEPAQKIASSRGQL
ncbi:MAG: MFS transporter [Pirellulaceae bacterium]